MAEDLRKNADTHKMNPEGAGVGASKRPPGNHPGEILHQRRNLPYSPYTMALGGFLIVAGVGYFSLYSMKKPEASAKDVARVSANIAHPKETHPHPNPQVDPEIPPPSGK